MSITLARIQLVMATRAEDTERLKAQDERNKDRRYGSVSKSLLEATKRHTNAVIPEGVLVQRPDAGPEPAVPQRMRAVGDGGNYRGPRGMSLVEKRRLLAKYAKGLNPAQLARAKTILGL